MVADSDDTARWQVRLQGGGLSGWAVGISNLVGALVKRYPNADSGDIRYLENLVDLVRRYLETSDPRRLSESMLIELETVLKGLTEYLNDACNRDGHTWK